MSILVSLHVVSVKSDCMGWFLRARMQRLGDTREWWGAVPAAQAVPQDPGPAAARLLPVRVGILRRGQVRGDPAPARRQEGRLAEPCQAQGGARPAAVPAPADTHVAPHAGAAWPLQAVMPGIAHS